MKNNYLDALNPVQREAAENTEGPVMIIAGAGSGKTRVLTFRIAHLINQGVEPFNILALTFTNKAAKEMRERIADISGHEARNVWMGTFHSIFAKILRFEHEKLNYPSNFTIYDTDDSKSLIKDLVREQHLDEKIYKPGLVLNRISGAKSNLMSVADYNNHSEVQYEDKSTGKPKMGLLYDLYTKRCFAAGAMDFDDLLFNMYRLITGFPDILHKYQHRFRYILLDEFQDTNYAQYVVTRKLAALHQNICVVGDDAQSIYAFRGANIQNILDFEKDYPDLKVFKLEQNYRSSQTIVKAANSVIVHNRKQLRKEVWTHNQTGEKIGLLKAGSDNEEGRLVSNAITSLITRQNLREKEIAILYRTNSQSRPFEEALRRQGIPYRIYGGLSFYKRKEIKDLIAYFRLTINPDDEEALKRIINYPARGIGKTTLDKLIVVAGESNSSIWKVINNLHEYPSIANTGTLKKIHDFAMLVRSFRVMLETHNAYDLASHIASSSGILKELFEDRSPEGINHYENVQELLNGIREFTEKVKELMDSDSTLPVNNEYDFPVMENSSDSLGSYLQEISLLTDADNDTDPSENNVVTLMTVHSAKGLEFQCVFVVGMEENLFPSHMSLQSRDDIEEERRLFYVAVTRAMKKLTLSFSLTRYKWGSLTGCEPSRFLEELDPTCLEHPLHGKAVNTSENKPWSGPGSGNNIKPSRTLKPLAESLGRQTITETDKINQVGSFDDAAAVQVGMEVQHARFGKGKVLSMDGGLADRRATIFFQSAGQKQILLKFAKLKIIS
jgi:DNA helicase II / ATP-dependent DNA helicase PcrA